MKRFGQVIGLKPEHLDEYVKAHAAVWPGCSTDPSEQHPQLLDLHRNGQLFAYFEYVGDDFEGDMKKMAHDAETQRWWEQMMPLQEPLVNPAEGGVVVGHEEVFHTD